MHIHLYPVENSFLKHPSEHLWLMTLPIYQGSMDKKEVKNLTLVEKIAHLGRAGHKSMTKERKVHCSSLQSNYCIKKITLYLCCLVVKLWPNHPHNYNIPLSYVIRLLFKCLPPDS